MNKISKYTEKIIDKLLDDYPRYGKALLEIKEACDMANDFEINIETRRFMTMCSLAVMGGHKLIAVKDIDGRYVRITVSDFNKLVRKVKKALDQTKYSI